MTNILNKTHAKLAEVKFRWIKYPKLTLLVLTFVLAYFLYYIGRFPAFHEYFVQLGYLTPFICGMFFVYGFTAVPAAAIFLAISRDYNIWIAAFVGGLGAMIGDLLIFYIVRTRLEKELEDIQEEKVFVWVKKVVYFVVPGWLRKVVAPFFIGFIIASPLPDEVGTILLSANRKISARKFMIVTFILNTVGILIFLVLGRV